MDKVPGQSMPCQDLVWSIEPAYLVSGLFRMIIAFNRMCGQQVV